MKRSFYGPLLLRYSTGGEQIQFYQPMDQIVTSSLEHSPVLKIKPVFFLNEPLMSWIKLFCRKFIMVNIICCSLHGVVFNHISGLLQTGCAGWFEQLFLPCGISSERVWISTVRRLYLPLAPKLAASQNYIVDNVRGHGHLILRHGICATKQIKIKRKAFMSLKQLVFYVLFVAR